MELQNLPMEHLLHPMDLQSPHTKPPNRPTKHPSHLMAHQHQCMHLHLPSTGARPMEPRQPQWCKLPMSGGCEQEIILSLDKSVGKEICCRDQRETDFQTSFNVDAGSDVSRPTREGRLDECYCVPVAQVSYIWKLLCFSGASLFPILLFQLLSDVLSVSFQQHCRRCLQGLLCTDQPKVKQQWKLISGLYFKLLLTIYDSG